MWIEMLENGLEIFSNLLTKENLTELLLFQQKMMVKTAKAGLEALKDLNGIEIPYSHVGYYSGFIVGFIIEEILIALFTAGTGNVAQAVNAATQGFSQTIKGATKFVKKGAMEFANTLENFLELLSQIRKGSKNLKKLLNDLENWVDDLFSSIRKEGEDLYDRELAEVEEIFRKGKTGAGGGKRYTRSGLRQIAKELEKRYSGIGLKVEIVTRKSHPERYENWTTYPKNTLASCNTRKIPPTMYLRDDATELTIQHEMWHIDDFSKLGFENYNSLPDWQLEEMVWERVWKSKHRWTEEEILESYKYYKEECGKQGAEYKAIEELDKLIKL